MNATHLIKSAQEIMSSSVQVPKVCFLIQKYPHLVPRLLSPILSQHQFSIEPS